MLFRLLGGSHVQGGKTYQSGDLVPCDEDLCAKFTGKFTCEDPDHVCTDECDEEEEDDEEGGSALGEDCTAEFEDCPEGYLVFKANGWYNIAAEDDPDTAINESKLRKGGVVEWFAAEDDE